MKTLVWFEHDDASVKEATLATVTAVSQLVEVDLVVAGSGCAAVTEQAAEIVGVDKVHLVDNAAYANALVENVAPLIVELMGQHDAFVAPRIEADPRFGAFPASPLQPRLNRVEVLDRPFGMAAGDDVDGYLRASRRQRTIKQRARFNSIATVKIR